ncbi:PIN domain-like protein [Laetiporus sulphureus 93-53]|uniref:Exonuclease 1 n=1 Tax=Laetiporus sulphureus 93-53 TaxID=1314785 RepID=A0A165DBE6_9APHY|nr:PIN domain-like protein [Laetiporus sulphureus 93-53]KZT04482.1 PIN domain-like protein [Laetiporus sulphureus 93-53]
MPGILSPEVFKPLPERLKSLSGKRIVIDGTLITQRLYRSPVEHEKRHILGWYRLIKQLTDHGVQVICVFDGKERNVAKAMETKRREDLRRLVKAQAVEEQKRYSRLSKVHRFVEPLDRPMREDLTERLRSMINNMEHILNAQNQPSLKATADQAQQLTVDSEDRLFPALSACEACDDQRKSHTSEALSQHSSMPAIVSNLPRDASGLHLDELATFHMTDDQHKETSLEIQIEQTAPSFPSLHDTKMFIQDGSLVDNSSAAPSLPPVQESKAVEETVLEETMEESPADSISAAFSLPPEREPRTVGETVLEETMEESPADSISAAFSLPPEREPRTVGETASEETIEQLHRNDTLTASSLPLEQESRLSDQNVAEGASSVSAAFSLTPEREPRTVGGTASEEVIEHSHGDDTFAATSLLPDQESRPAEQSVAEEASSEETVLEETTEELPADSISAAFSLLPDQESRTIEQTASEEVIEHLHGDDAFAVSSLPLNQDSRQADQNDIEEASSEETVLEETMEELPTDSISAAFTLPPDRESTTELRGVDTSAASPLPLDQEPRPADQNVVEEASPGISSSDGTIFVRNLMGLTNEASADTNEHAYTAPQEPEIAPEDIIPAILECYDDFWQSASKVKALPEPSSAECVTSTGLVESAEEAPGEMKLTEMSKKQKQLITEESLVWSRLAESPPNNSASETVESELAALMDKSSAMVESFKRRVDGPTSQTYEESKEIIRAMGIPVIDTSGPYEAEALASLLMLKGHVDYVASEDTDVLAFQATLLRNLSSLQDLLDVISGAEVRDALQLDPDSFLDFLLLMGTDFSVRIKNLGPVNALKFIRKYGSIERIVKILDGHQRFRLPFPRDEYLGQVRQARQAFTKLPPMPDLALLQPQEFNEDEVDRLLSHHELASAAELDQYFAAQLPTAGFEDYNNAFSGNYFNSKGLVRNYSDDDPDESE